MYKRSVAKKFVVALFCLCSMHTAFAGYEREVAENHGELRDKLYKFVETGDLELIDELKKVLEKRLELVKKLGRKVVRKIEVECADESQEKHLEAFRLELGADTVSDRVRVFRLKKLEILLSFEENKFVLEQARRYFELTEALEKVIRELIEIGSNLICLQASTYLEECLIGCKYVSSSNGFIEVIETLVEKLNTLKTADGLGNLTNVEMGNDGYFIHRVIDNIIKFSKNAGAFSDQLYKYAEKFDLLL